MKNLIPRQTLTFGFIGTTILFTPLSTQALTVGEVINPQQNNGGWVTDMADILSSKTETELNSLIDDLEQNNGAEIAVVTVPETAPAASPKAFATELFNHWGIGKADAGNGILFLVSMADKRVEIETGYGIESILPDTTVAQIIDTKITPQYKHGNFDSGTLDGTKALVATLQPAADLQNSPQLIAQTGNEPKTSWLTRQNASFIILLGLILLLWWTIDRTMTADGNSSNRNRRHRSRSSSHNYYTGCSSSSNSSSGSSGGGFGGGSSDGGGAGGDF